MKTKTEKDGQHPSSNYLVIGDPNEPSTWHLRVRNTSGTLDHKLMGDAWAALHEGFRGNEYSGPQREQAITRLTELYHSEGMETPDGQAPPHPVSNRGSGSRVVVNRAFESDGGWIHIVPKGELPNSEAGIVQVLDDKSMDSILANIERVKNRLGDKWPGVYAGREHFYYDPSKDSEALAWFKNFQNRDDGIWASEDGLTDIGREAIRNKRYKYTSFVADRSDLQKIEGDRYRVMAIDTVGFTNMANGKELLTPITNRGAADERRVSHETGILISPTMEQYLRSHADAESAESGESSAVEKWFDCVAHILQACRAKTGRRFDFGAAWDLAKAKNPDLYQDAFGAPENDGPASSEGVANAALQEVSTLTNRIKTASGMDFGHAWKFVKEQLPQVFNRQFVSRSPVANRSLVDEGNMAGVQKRAEKLFSELVQAEQTQYNISYSQAFTRVMNREKTLRDLANYTIAPREAFEREPGLRGKLLPGVANRENNPIDEGAVLGNATMLYNDLIRKEMKAGASQMVAFRSVINKHTILCKLVNREIAPKEAFTLEPGLRGKLA